MKGADFNRMEELQARKDGAELVKNSGRGERKGDARTQHLLIDYKFTEKGSFALNYKNFKDFKKQAFADGDREPVVVAIFTEGNEKIAMVDWQWLQDLIAERDEYKWMYEGLG
jgi:hypothetical protein